MKTKIIYTTFAVFMTSVCLCGCSKTNDTSTTVENVPVQQIAEVVQPVEQVKPVEVKKTEIDTDKELKNISVTHEVSNLFDNQKKLTIFIKNNSKYIFSGSLPFIVKNGEDTVHSDTIIVENLKPGEQTFSNAVLDTNTITDVIYSDSVIANNLAKSIEKNIKNPDTSPSWLSPEFKEIGIKSVEQSRVDSEATKKLKQSILDGFGGAGNPKYKASWYDDIKDIHVYSDGSNKTAVVIVSKPDNSNVIMGAVFYNDGINKTEVRDESNNIITEKVK